MAAACASVIVSIPVSDDSLHSDDIANGDGTQDERVRWLKKRYSTLQQKLEESSAAEEQLIQFGQLLRHHCSQDEFTRFIDETKKSNPQVLALLKGKIILKESQSVCRAIHQAWNVWIWDLPSTLPTPQSLGKNFAVDLRNLSRLADYDQACDLLASSLQYRTTTRSENKSKLRGISSKEWLTSWDVKTAIKNVTSSRDQDHQSHSLQVNQLQTPDPSRQSSPIVQDDQDEDVTEEGVELNLQNETVRPEFVNNTKTKDAEPTLDDGARRRNISEENAELNDEDGLVLGNITIRNSGRLKRRRDENEEQSEEYTKIEEERSKMPRHLRRIDFKALAKKRPSTVFEGDSIQTPPQFTPPLDPTPLHRSRNPDPLRRRSPVVAARASLGSPSSSAADSDEIEVGRHVGDNASMDAEGSYLSAGFDITMDDGVGSDDDDEVVSSREISHTPSPRYFERGGDFTPLQLDGSNEQSFEESPDAEHHSTPSSIRMRPPTAFKKHAPAAYRLPLTAVLKAPSETRTTFKESALAHTAHSTAAAQKCTSTITSPEPDMASSHEEDSKITAFHMAPADTQKPSVPPEPPLMLESLKPGMRLISSAVGEPLHLVHSDSYTVLDHEYLNVDVDKPLRARLQKGASKVLMSLHHQTPCQHWSLCSMDLKTGLVQHYNTLHDPRFAKSVETRLLTLCRQLMECYQDQSSRTVQSRFESMHGPRQDNTYDCGVYVAVTGIHILADLEIPQSIPCDLWRLVLRSAISASPEPPAGRSSVDTSSFSMEELQRQHEGIRAELDDIHQTQLVIQRILDKTAARNGTLHQQLAILQTKVQSLETVNDLLAKQKPLSAVCDTSVHDGIELSLKDRRHELCVCKTQSDRTGSATSAWIAAMTFLAHARQQTWEAVGATAHSLRELEEAAATKKRQEKLAADRIRMDEIRAQRARLAEEQEAEAVEREARTARMAAEAKLRADEWATKMRELDAAEEALLAE